MAADVMIYRWTGSVAGQQDVCTTKTPVGNGSNIRVSASDNPWTVETTNPVQIPSSSTPNYSWWVTTRLACTNTGPSVQITNLRWYTSTNNLLGTELWCIGNASSHYTPAVTGGTTGYSQRLTQNTVSGLYDTISDTAYSDPNQIGNVFHWTGNNVLNFHTVSYTAANYASGIRDIGDWFVYQIAVGQNANPGRSGTGTTFNFKYDEQ